MLFINGCNLKETDIRLRTEQRETKHDALVAFISELNYLRYAHVLCRILCSCNYSFDDIAKIVRNWHLVTL